MILSHPKCRHCCPNNDKNSWAPSCDLFLTPCLALTHSFEVSAVNVGTNRLIRVYKEVAVCFSVFTIFIALLLLCLFIQYLFTYLKIIVKFHMVEHVESNLFHI